MVYDEEFAEIDGLAAWSKCADCAAAKPLLLDTLRRNLGPNPYSLKRGEPSGPVASVIERKVGSSCLDGW
jgi:hypothetical protein